MSDTKTLITELFNKNISDPIKQEFKALIAKFKAEEVKAEETPAAPADTYTELPLADGTVLKYTGDLAVGAKCLLVTPDGEVPAPEGDLALADGTVITIKKDGENSVIADIKAPAPMADQKMADFIKKVIEDSVTTLTTKMSAIEKENSTLKAEFEASKLKIAEKSAEIKTLTNIVTEMAAITDAKPIVTPTAYIRKPISPR